MSNIDLAQRLRLDRRMLSPLSYQLRDQLIDLIMDDTLPLQSSLPLPEILATMIGCDSTVVEQCYELMESAHYIVWNRPLAPKVWTFAMHADFSQGMVTVPEMIAHLGLTMRIEVIDQSILTISKELHQLTGLSIGSRVYFHRRVYYGNEIPFAVIHHYTPVQLIPDLLDWIDTNQPFFPQFRARGLFPLTSAQLHMRSITYDVDLSNLLKLRQNAVGLRVINQLFDEHHRMFQCDINYFTNRYYFDLHLPL